MQAAIRRASCGHCKDESKSGERATDQPRKSCLCRSIGLAARDNPTFTYMNGTGVMIAGQLFNHLLYHFTLTYSNWESVMVCFSESFESLSAGLQKSLWEVGAVPEQHRTDSLSAAVNLTFAVEVVNRPFLRAIGR